MDASTIECDTLMEFCFDTELFYCENVPGKSLLAPIPKLNRKN